MHLRSWKVTCTASRRNITANIRTEEVHQKDNGSTGMFEATEGFAMMEQRLLRAYMWRKIAFGMPNSPE